VAKCAELGVTSQGTTRDDALYNLREAVELFLEDSDVLPKKTSVASFEIEYAA
jgi:predicted RNase H-like HicB family nuclease